MPFPQAVLLCPCSMRLSQAHHNRSNRSQQQVAVRAAAVSLLHSVARSVHVLHVCMLHMCCSGMDVIFVCNRQRDYADISSPAHTPGALACQCPGPCSCMSLGPLHMPSAAEGVAEWLILLLHLDKRSSS